MLMGQLSQALWVDKCTSSPSLMITPYLDKWNSLLKFGILECLKAFKTMIELKMRTKIKCMNFDKSDECYVIYNEVGRNLGPFMRHL